MSQAVDKTLNDISPKLLDLVKNKNLLVVGSFVMYHFMKENNLEPNFTPNNINFITKSSEKETVKFFFDNVLTDRFYTYPYTTKRYERFFIKYITPTTKSNIKLLVLSPNYTGTLVGYANSYFDMDICKCWYDGETLFGPFEALQKREITLYLDRIWDIYHIKDRVNKYIQRGFTMKKLEYFSHQHY